jgi:hypothetical protein
MSEAASLSSPAPRREDLPDGRVRIHFTGPILHFTETKTSVTLRLPTVGEVLDRGDPLTFVVDDQASMPVVDRPAMREWFKALVVDHDADILLMQADTALGLLVEDVILGFFRSARRRLNPPSAQP